MQFTYLTTALLATLAAAAPLPGGLGGLNSLVPAGLTDSLGQSGGPLSLLSGGAKAATGAFGKREAEAIAGGGLPGLDLFSSLLGGVTGGGGKKDKKGGSPLGGGLPVPIPGVGR